MITLTKQIEVLKYRLENEFDFYVDGNNERYPDSLVLRVFGKDVCILLLLNNPDRTDFTNPLDGVKILVKCYGRNLKTTQKQAASKRAKWVFVWDLFNAGWIETPPPSTWSEMVVP